uniref:Uncharacterized protein n=1 Tax=Mycena chlorophos TaxID=658473 RepID=A0ABQ0LSW6_MYCCL|nr:predicted protein [Mycena chlorophos]
MERRVRRMSHGQASGEVDPSDEFRQANRHASTAFVQWRHEQTSPSSIRVHHVTCLSLSSQPATSETSSPYSRKTQTSPSYVICLIRSARIKSANYALLFTLGLRTSNTPTLHTPTTINSYQR